MESGFSDKTLPVKLKTAKMLDGPLKELRTESKTDKITAPKNAKPPPKRPPPKQEELHHQIGSALLLGAVPLGVQPGDIKKTFRFLAQKIASFSRILFEKTIEGIRKLYC